MKLKKTASLKGPFGVWLGAVIVWAIYRNFFLLNEIVEELVIKPAVFVYPVLLYLHFQKRLTFASLGIQIKDKKSIFIWGCGLGLVVALYSLGIALFSGVTINSSALFPVVMLTNAAVSVATALSEELLYRGFLLQRIEQRFRQPFVANILTAVLFALHHVSIALFVFHYSGIALGTYLVTIFVSGLLYGFIFQKSRSVVASSIAHALWNFAQTFII